mgnify:CR=1 FL=1
MNIKAFKKTCCLGLMLMLTTNAFAGSTWYRDCEVKLSSPSSAKGVVYVEPYFRYRKTALKTGPAQTAHMKASLGTDAGYYYACYLYAYPKPGYVLAGFVTKSDFQAGRTSSSYYLKNHQGNTGKSGDYFDIVRADTLIDSKNSDPADKSYYSFSARSSREYYAVFKSEVSKTVTCAAPGSLSEATSNANATKADKLIVRGKINQSDFEYLNFLVKNANLVKIDLTGASTWEIPESAFSGCSNLYEVKLPTSGLQSIRANSFKGCYSLKRVSVPSSVIVDPTAFTDCYSKDLNL